MSSPPRRRLLTTGLLAAATAVIIGGGLIWKYRPTSDANPEAGAKFTVREGPLVISVTEAGTIKPRDQVVIKNQLEGRATILYLIQEGKRVKKGDLLVELDASDLVDRKVDQQNSVDNAEAAFIQSRENLEVVKNQAKSDVEKAELTLRFAKEDLQQYREGEYPNQRTDLQNRIILAEEDVQRTDKKLELSTKLHEEKYLSDTELQGDQLAAKKAKLDLELAKSNLELLEKYTYKRQIDQLTSDIKQAEMALERTQRRARADVVQAEAQLRAREAEFARQKVKLNKLEEQIGKAKIVAPTDGEVVYATSAQFRFRGNVEPLDEGQEVRERQELIHLPTAHTFKAEINVHEASLKKIYKGLPARLTVDALPGRTFTGKVARIAPLPDARSMFMNPDLKVYQTEIDIEGGGDVLRTGMTCQAEIIVERYEKATYVPVQCVVRVQGKPTVYMATDNGGEPREVEIGLDNNRMVHTKKGLKAGDVVMLTPPLHSTETATKLKSLPDVDIPPRPAARKSGRAGAGGSRPAGAEGRRQGGARRRRGEGTGRGSGEEAGERGAGRERRGGSGKGRASRRRPPE